MQKLSVVGAVALALCAAVITTTPALAAESGADYVALGDSAAAGPGIAPIDNSHPLCQRSNVDYPKLVAQRLSLSVRDVTCSGATTDHMTQNQYPLVAPQFDALSRATKVVTVEIGANNMLRAGVTAGAPIPSDVSGKIGAVLKGIKDRAPDADVFVVGYPTYFKDGVGCPLRNVNLPGGPKRLQDSLTRLNDTLERQAQDNDAQYVDLEGPSRDHGVCSSDNWVNPVSGTLLNGVGYHPNRNGMSHFADIVASAIKGRD